jgi:hypothetical protein
MWIVKPRRTLAESRSSLLIWNKIQTNSDRSAWIIRLHADFVWISAMFWGMPPAEHVPP